jgi:hypothetical protein
MDEATVDRWLANQMGSRKVQRHKAAVDARRRADRSRRRLEVASAASRARVDALSSNAGGPAGSVRQLQAKVSREMARYDGLPRAKRRSAAQNSRVTARRANVHETRPARPGKVVRELGGFQEYAGPSFYSPHTLTLGDKIRLLKEAGRLRVEGKSLEPVNAELRKYGLEYRAPERAA